MKKILTLMICLGAVTLASAQDIREMEDVRDIILGERKDGSSRNGDRDVVLGRRDDRRYDERNRYPKNSSKSTEASRINREYEAKINSIRNNRHLSRSEKDRAIRQLESDRNRKLRQLNERRDDRRYDRDDDDRRYSGNKNNKNKKYKKGKGNNGNHYGWQKGKVNPHRDRD